MIGMEGAMTVSSHITSPRKASDFRRAKGCRRVVTYSLATFSIAWAVANGGTLAALASMISIIILIKYVITSLAGQKALISGTLSYNATLGNASPITSTSVTCRAQSSTNHNRRCE